MATKAEYMREWRAKHPEYKEYMREWRAKHAEQIKAYRKRHYEANFGREIDLAVFWQQEHVVEMAIHRKIAAAHARYPGRISAQDIRELIDRVGWICCWCKKAITSLRDFTLEHLEPVNDPKHLAIACHACNSAKLPTNGRTSRESIEERRARINVSAAKRTYDAEWRRAHREECNAAQRARYHANIEQRRAYFREWQRKKRERQRNAT